MGVGIAEERVDGGGAEGVVAAGDDLVEVDETYVFGSGYLLGPAAVGGGVSDDVTVEPEFTGNERTEDGSGAFGAGVGDVFTQVPAEGVDGLVGVSAGILHVQGFLADAGEAASAGGHACRRSGWRRWRSGAGQETLIGDGRGAGKVDAAVVVAELDEDEVAGLDEFEGRVPVSGGDVGMAGEASDGAIDDVNFGGVEEVGDGGSPAPEAVGAEAVPIAGGRVAYEDQVGEARVGGAGEAEAFLLGFRVGRCGRARGWGLLGGESEKRDEAGDSGCKQGVRRGGELSGHGFFFRGVLVSRLVCGGVVQCICEVAGLYLRRGGREKRRG